MKFNNYNHPELSDEKKTNLGMVKAKGDIWVAKSAVGIYNIDKYNFFKDNQLTGFVYKRSFLDYLYTLKKGHLTVLETTFEMMRNELTFNISSGQRPEANGQYSAILEYSTENVPHSNKLYLIDDMHRLLWQYEFSILTFKTSLEELYNESRQTI